MKKIILKFFLVISIFITFPYFHLQANSGSIYSLNQTWLGMDGKEVVLKQLIGKPAVVTMIFTSCLGACPLMVSNIKKFDKELSTKEKKEIKYYLFSIDPKRDTKDVLAAFSKKMELDDRWMLFNSNSDNVRELSVALGFSYKELEGGDFTHSSSLFLISKDGEVLEKYDSGNSWTNFMAKYRAELEKGDKKQ